MSLNKSCKALPPVPELVEFAEAVFADVWREEKRNSTSRVEELKKQIQELENKIELHVDELLTTKSKNIKVRIQQRIDDYTEQKVTLEMKYESSQLTQEDFGVVLSSVKDVLRNPYGLWKEGNLERKQLVQQLVFPNRLIYEQNARKFRNPEKALVYCFLEELPSKKDGMVGPEGLEPPTKPL